MLDQILLLAHLPRQRAPTTSSFSMPTSDVREPSIVEALCCASSATPPSRLPAAGRRARWRL